MNPTSPFVFALQCIGASAAILGAGVLLLDLCAWAVGRVFSAGCAPNT